MKIKMKNELTYKEKNGIYYVDGDLPKQPNVNIGKYGRMRLDYLKKHRRGTYTTLLTTCKLSAHLAETDLEARRRVRELTEAFAKANGITEQLKAENGDYLPSLVFQHIPVPEFFDVIKKVPKGTKGAVPAYGEHENEYFVLNDETIAEGGFMLESPASPDVNTGEFEAMSEKGDVLGIYVGHDHNNSFVVKYKGVDLGYTQGAGFNVYGPGENRGVRIFELDETAPREYKTHTATFKELCGTKIKTPVKEFIYKHAPTSPRAVKPILIKVGIGIAAIAAVYAAYKFFTGFNI